MSQQEKVKIELRVGDAEIVLEGSENYIEELIAGNVLFQFIESFQASIAEIPVESSGTITLQSDLPPTISQSKGLADALQQLFDGDWGRTPRMLQDITNALEVNGIYYNVKSISAQLLSMIKQGKLRRIGTRGQYRYVK